MIHLETENTTNDVTLLSNVNVEFVSLVRNGANRIPFAVIKENKTEESTEMSLERIHAIIQPNGKDIKSLEELYGAEWFSQVRLDNAVKREHDVVFIQRPRTDFNDENALRITEAGHGLSFKAGRLLEEVIKAEGATVGLAIPTASGDVAKPDTKDDTKCGYDDMAISIEVPQTPTIVATPDMLRAILDPESQTAIPKSFDEEFDRKVWPFVDGIRGGMALAPDGATRKKICLPLCDSMRTFIEKSIAEMDAGTMKADTTSKREDKTAQTEIEVKTEAVQTDASDTDTETAKGADDMELTLNDDVKTFLRDTIKEAVADAVPAKTAEADATKTETTEIGKDADVITAATTDVKAEMEALERKFDEVAAKSQQEMDELREKYTALSHRARQQPSGGEDSAVKTSDKPKSSWEGLQLGR